MNKFAPVSKLLNILGWFVAVILLLVPFHAFLTVWPASLVHHYTFLRLWKEFLLVPVVFGALYYLFKEPKLHKKIAGLWAVRLIIAYTILLLVCGFVALANHGVTAKAMWYGLLVDLRFLVFFLAVLVLANKTDWLQQRWIKLLLGPAVLVAAFGILQYLVLPFDFLKHFGYGDSTIPPYETINHNINHIRVASTLRGANPLGAYLIVPICALAVMLVKEKRLRREKLVLGIGLILALLFSFSRSAWLGAALGIIVVAWLSLKYAQAQKAAIWTVAGLLIVSVLAGVLFRNNLSFENFVFHTDRASKIATSSNEGHSAAFKYASKDIIHHPLGSGVGTAGPQSFYNNGQAKIAENYFLQIGQEAGIIGIILFIGICVSVGQMLYVKRANPLALALLASLIGLTLVNLLSHAWEDDTLAYVWWGFAAIALAYPVSRKNS